MISRKISSLVLVGATAFTMNTAFAAANLEAKPAPIDYATATGLYGDIGVGYALTDWKNEFGSGAGVSYKNSNGGFSYAADLGYQFTKYLAAEIGFNWLPTTKMTTTAATTVSTIGTTKIRSYLISGALKFIAPIYYNFDVFGKAGVGYYRTTFSGATTLSKTTSTSPVFGAGFDYYFDNGFFLNGIYQHYSGKRRINVTSTINRYQTDPNVFLAKVGYKFTM